MFSPIFRLLSAIGVIFASTCLSSSAREKPQLSLQVLATFDYPGSSLTIPHGINQRGDVAGEFTDITGAHAFARFSDGSFSLPITHPEDNQGETFGLDINRSTLVGFYFDLTSFVSHSFAYAGQTFTSLDIPGAISTTAIGLNSANDYCGSVDDGSGVMQAFVSSAGQLTEFVLPGATFTSANAINDLDSVAGVYQLGSANNHGFVRDAAGSLTYPIDYPGATSTILRGINNRGWVAGGYVGTDLVQHGFVFRPPDGFLAYDYPGATFTTFEGINDRGQICGQYKDANGQRHGFIARVH